MMRKLRIAMIGIKAIPARDGGFETAVDEMSRGMVASGHEVVVYNRSGMSVHPGNNYEGVELVEDHICGIIVIWRIGIVNLYFRRFTYVHRGMYACCHRH